MVAIISKIINICQSTSIIKVTLTDLSLQELLVKIVQSQSLKGVSANKTIVNSSFLNHLIQITRQNITNKIDLKSISIISGMSTSSIYHIFKNKFGIRPMEFIILDCKFISQRKILFYEK